MASTALAAMSSGRSPYFYNTISCFRVYHQPVASYFKCLDYILIFIYLKNFPFILSFSTSMSRYSSCRFHDFAYAERTSKDDILIKAFFSVRSSCAVPFHVHSSFRSCQSRCGRKGKTLAFTQPIVVGAELFVLQVQRTVALTVTFFRRFSIICLTRNSRMFMIGLGELLTWESTARLYVHISRLSSIQNVTCR